MLLAHVPPHMLTRPLLAGSLSAANEHETKALEMDAPLQHPRYYPHTKGVWSGPKDGEEKGGEEDGEEEEEEEEEAAEERR